jgi:hypothetical protein
MLKLAVKLDGCHQSWLGGSLDIDGHIGPFVFAKYVAEEVLNLLR